MLDPLYEEQVTKVLDEIEHDPSREALWNAICDALHLVCLNPGSAEAHREEIRTLTNPMWQVPIRCRTEDDDWVLLWRPEGADAHIYYVGPRRFGR